MTTFNIYYSWKLRVMAQFVLSELSRSMYYLQQRYTCKPTSRFSFVLFELSTLISRLCSYHADKLICQDSILAPDLNSAGDRSHILFTILVSGRTLYFY
jgi:hypothetical protein